MNYQQIEQDLAAMTERSKLYQIVKNEVEKRGHWKARSRGEPFNRGEDIRRNDLKSKSAPANIHIEQTYETNADWGA